MSLEIQTTSESSQAKSDLALLRKSVDNIGKSTEKVSRGFDRIAKSIAIAVTAFAGFKGFTSVSDDITNLENKLRAVTKTQQGFTDALANVKKVAVNTRSDLQAVGTLYSKVALAGKRFNVAQSDVAKFSSAVTKSLALSGATAAETAGAIQQLGQGLASGKFAGDELRTVLESAPLLAEQLAIGLKTNVGALRDLGAEGKLTFDAVFGAILKQQDIINAKFEQMGVTYGQAFTNIGNAFTILFDSIGKKLSTNGFSLASLINDFAKSIAELALNLDYYILAFNVGIANILHKINRAIDFIYLRYKTFFDNIINSISRVGITVVKNILQMYNKIKATIKDIFEFNRFNLDFTAIFDGIDLIGLRFYQGFTKIYDRIVTLFANFKVNEIRLEDIFPGLDTTLTYVKSFVDKIVGYFDWLYDIIIGNSIVPDLIIGVADWFRKLLNAPVRYLQDFVNVVATAFHALKVGIIGGAFSFVLGAGKIGVTISFIASSLLTLLSNANTFSKSFSTVFDFSIKKVDSAFEWLYDRLIGNSWIPDIVDGITNGFDSLLGDPLRSVFTFVKEVDAKFKGLVFSLLATLSAFFLFKFRNILAKPLLLFALPATAIAAGIKTLSESIKEQEKQIAFGVRNVSSIYEIMFNKIKRGFVSVASYVKDLFNENTLTRVFKQIAGIRDEASGKLFGKTIDTTANVGLGRERFKEERSFGHDFLSLFPQDQIANVATAIAAAIGGAFLLFTRNPIILSAFTTLLTIGWVKAVKGAAGLEAINEFTGRIAFGITSILKNIIDAIFDGSILKDIPGFLTFFAKAILIFSAGRKLMLEILKNVAFAPTKATGALYERANLVRTERSNARLGEKIKNLPDKLRDTFQRSIVNRDNAFNRLIGKTTVQGASLNRNDIASRVATKNFDNLNKSSKRLLSAAILAQKNVKIAGKSLENEDIRQATTKPLLAIQKKNASFIDSTRASIRESTAATLLAARNFSAGVGGLVGGVAGFQLGQEIADTLVNAPGWVQVGVTLGTAMVGQFAGAGISLIAFSLVKNLGKGLLLLFARLPIFAIPAAIGAALYAGYTLFKNLGSEWKKQLFGFEPEVESNIDVSVSTLKDSLAQYKNLVDAQLRQKEVLRQNPLYAKQAKATLDIIEHQMESWKEKILYITERLSKVEEARPLLGKGIANLNELGFESLTNALNEIYKVPPTVKQIIENSGLERNASNELLMDTAKTTSSKIAEVFKRREETEKANEVERQKNLKENQAENKRNTEEFSKATATFGTFINSIPTIFTDGFRGFLDQNAVSRYKTKEGLADGGYISGPGGSREDKIPAMLSNGEYVVNAKDAAKNYSLLESINKGRISKFADGGYISGPGGPIEDKIPAMLSNGEFVINAKNTAKFRPLLEQINKSKLPGFSTGSPSTIIPNLAAYGDTSESKQFINLLKDAFSQISKDFSQVIYDLFNDKTSIGYKFGEKSTTQAQKEIIEELKRLNVSFKPDTIKATDSKNLEYVVDLIDKLKDSIEVTKGEKEGTNAQNIAKSNEKEARKQLKERLRLIEEGASSGKNKAEVLTLQKQFEKIAEVLPGLNLSFDEFVDISFELRRVLFNQAKALGERIDIIKALPAGSKIKDKTTDEDRLSLSGAFNAELRSVRTPFKTMEKALNDISVNMSRSVFNLLDSGQKTLIEQYKDSANTALRIIENPISLPEVRAQAEKSFSKSINMINTVIKRGATNALSGAEGIVASFNEFGLSLSKRAGDLIKPETTKIAEQYIQGLQQAYDAVQNAPNDAGRRLASEAYYQILDGAETFISTVNNKFSGKSKQAGIAFGQDVRGILSESLNSFLKSETSLQTLAEEFLDKITSRVIDTVTEGFTNAFLNVSGTEGFLESIGSDLFGLGSFDFDKINPFASNKDKAVVTKDLPSIAGTTLLGSPFGNNIAANDPMSLCGCMGQSITESLTGSIFDGFSVNNGLEPGGNLQPVGGLFNQKNMSFDELLTASMTTSETLIGMKAQDQKLFGSLGESFLSGLDGLGDLLGGALQSLGGLFGGGSGGFDIGSLITTGLSFFAAEGGLVKGPGTGTSDSIAAALSNNEFVVNAKATKKHLGLLHAINSGNLRKFAEGGLVSSTLLQTPPLSAPDMGDKRMPESGRQTTINLTITGDISRQTRSEIYQMLPTIAQGVNGYNKEKGIF